MARMSDEEIQSVFDDYNKLRAKNNYWVEAGMALVEFLHEKYGMRYADIYEVAESNERAKYYRELLAAPRISPNVVSIGAK